ncbi:type VI secretion system tube protein TssD [Tamlana sp. 2_MG-2023]|uniref:type VI secretion system tube protein TssD n=1 Tax=unclassified Tamlana TaxID=2614803 RepID=UPI0026E1DDD4|nr:MULTISPECIES: type VI secretion system tube protein TssD [unclassified Tamlana]MDO6761526.1 type VI secretion system tube protein TssD [Tamlana sp. 2_MG-2023]MDO6792380.1 type VI secretion system tube protein TssD [Tamlana sp. 1_MG-2023]
MSVHAKLIIDRKEVNILWFNFGFNQQADRSGRPSQKPVFIGLSLKIETRKDLELADWSFAPNQPKQIEIHIYPIILGGKTRKLYFYDCHLVNWKNAFSSSGSEPMAETLEITSAGVEASSSEGVYSATWRETFLRPEVEPTLLNNTEEPIPKIIDFYTTNKQGNRVQKYNIGDIINVIIKSENKIGDIIKINLKDKIKDFKYQGVLLENDSMDYKIESNDETIELEVVKQN